MKGRWRTLVPLYGAALQSYLRKGSAVHLRTARKLGIRAVALGLETLDLALLHEQALLAQELILSDAASRKHFILRSNAFFAEAIVPMEEGHHVALEANVRLSRMNQSLNRRTRDLADTNQRLKKEIARRRVVEKTLRESERQSSHLLEQSQNLQEELRHLSRRILSVQEDERKRISRELHDVIAQVLTGINVRLAVLKKEAASENKGLCRKISHTQRLVEKSVEIVFRFAHDLRPAVLDHLGLLPALHTFLKSYIRETGIRVNLTAFSGPDELDTSRRTVLYRVAQESLANVARHAHATRVAVTIQKHPKAISLQIKDNGQSFNAQQLLHARKKKRMGLLGMRERVEMVGGTFTVDSAPGKGTTVQAVIPLRGKFREHAPT